MIQEDERVSFIKTGPISAMSVKIVIEMTEISAFLGIGLLGLTKISNISRDFRNLKEKKKT